MEKVTEKIKKHRFRRMLPYIIISYIFVLFPSLAILIGGEKGLSSVAVAAILLYIPAVILVYILIGMLFPRINALDDTDVSESDTSVFGVLSSVKTPVIIFDNNGIIVWFNRSFMLCGEFSDSIYGENIEKLCGISAEELLTSESDIGHEYARFGRTWGVKGYRMTLRGKQYIMSIWHDRSETAALYDRINREASVVHIL